jgi:heat shock protein HslJ
VTNDLEAEIREALRSRAMTVTADDLGRRDEPARAGRRPILAALATAAVVAALAIGVGVAVWPSSNDGKQPPATGTSVNVVGIKWQFVKGIQGTTNFTSPSERVSVVFNRDGTYGADDGVNYTSGKYRQTATGITIAAAGTTLVGYAGHDPNVLATQTAFASLSSGRSEVAAHLGGDGELVLSGPGYTLWFSNAGPADTPSTPASPTSTRKS